MYKWWRVSDKPLEIRNQIKHLNKKLSRSNRKQVELTCTMDLKSMINLAPANPLPDSSILLPEYVEWFRTTFADHEVALDLDEYLFFAYLFYFYYLHQIKYDIESEVFAYGTLS